MFPSTPHRVDLSKRFLGFVTRQILVNQTLRPTGSLSLCGGRTRLLSRFSNRFLHKREDESDSASLTSLKFVSD